MAEKDKDAEVAPARASSRAATAEAEETPEPPKPGEIVRTEGGITDRDILGGGIKETLNIPVTAAPKDYTRMQRLLIRAAQTKVAKALGPMERPLVEWGLYGEGDTIDGHYILVDLDSGDKIEVIDRLEIKDDKVYANAQNLNKLLMKGDALKELL